MADHFERLGLPRRFSVDPAAVERAYLAKSREVHPDFHAGAPAADQRAMLEQTAALNEAYLALKDPFRRAEYLLTLLGGPTAKQEKNLDQAFLMEMMDVRERIEDGRAAGTVPSEVRDELEQRESDLMVRVAANFERFGANPGEASSLLNVRRALNAVKTIRSLLRDLD